VLSRLTAEKGAPESSATQRRLWKAAEKLLPVTPADNRDYANAVMELGATVCLPKNPACLFCPWNARCVAQQRGNPADYPRAKAAKPRPHRQWLAYFIKRGDGAVLAQKRESSGIWGGLWQLPTLEWPGRGLEKFIARDFAVRRWGRPSAAVKTRAAVIEHAFTHFDLTLTVVRVPVRPGLLTGALPEGAEWLSLRQLRAKPLPKPYVMLLDQLAQRKLKMA
jgi:A/G-specific adenine glycosylase